jgi:hypothetical protein
VSVDKIAFLGTTARTFRSIRLRPTAQASEIQCYTPGTGTIALENDGHIDSFRPVAMQLDELVFRRNRLHTILS